MLDRLFGYNVHYRLHLLGLSGIAAGLPLNKVVLSISMMFLILNLLLEGKYKSYFKLLKTNRFFWILLAFFGIHVIGLLWTSNFEYALHDLRTKLPILVISVALCAKPILKTDNKDFLLIVFLASILFTSLFNYLSYQHIIGQRIYDDIRGMSLFVSHVRYAIMVAFAFGVTIAFVIQNKYRVALIPVAIWLIYYLFYSQIISGIIGLSAILFLLPAYYFGNKRPALISVSYLALMIPVVLAVIWLLEPMNFTKADISKLDKRTKEGNLYLHDLSDIVPETGLPVGVYYCRKEMEREWYRRSSTDLNSVDLRNNFIRENLRRYLTSKGLRKDAEGVKALTNEEIQHIENGCASVHCKGLLGRMYGIKYQLVNHSDPNGHSLLQRLEYWKTGSIIALNNPLIGVGTGDVDDEFQKTYNSEKSKLATELRRRAHNQFLTLFITFGFGGLIIFIWLLARFIKFNWCSREIVPLMFIAVFIASCLIEDTVETQVGVCFFAFFYALFSINSASEGITSQ